MERDEGKVFVDSCVKVSIKEKAILREYTREEAIQRVSQCFPNQVDISLVFPRKDQNGKTKDVFSIMEIDEAVTDLIEMSAREEVHEKYAKSMHMQPWENFRATIKGEREGASSSVEIEYGSGIVVGKNFVVTAKHVVDENLKDKNKNIFISNSKIGVEELPCEVLDLDASLDLALLYCRGLEGIIPHKLLFSKQMPYTGLEIYCFGYSHTNTGKSAYLARGIVSGVTERYGNPPLTVLNCSVNHGFSGGPVVARIDGKLKITGIILQKQVKKILSIAEQTFIEEARRSMGSNASCISEEENWETKLILKMYDALEMHCQPDFCNAVPGNLVIQFLEKHITESEELKYLMM